MTSRSTRALGILTACWAVPYIVSKIHFAIEAKLGIHFGPTIYPSDYADYDGPADVAAGQWANMAVAVAFTLLSLLPATPLGTRINRWIIAVPLIGFAAFQLSFAAGNLYRAVTTERGGAVFGVYLVVWAAALIAVAIAALRRGPGRAQAEDAGSEMSAARPGSRS